MSNHVTILSLGGGIQSTALALLLHEEKLPGIPTPDAAIFADTGAEPPWVYRTIASLADILSYPVLTTAASNLEQDTLLAIARQPSGRRPAQTADSIFLDIPTYIGHGRPAKPTTRRCTQDYKIAPIRRTIRQRFGWPVTVTQYLGISADEAVRIKPSRVRYITNYHPLADLRWTRANCRAYLREHWPNIDVGRSACWFCPYHSDAEWLNIADNAPELFQHALDLEEKLQALTPPQHLHQNRSIHDVVAQARMQGALPIRIPGDECSGHCFV